MAVVTGRACLNVPGFFASGNFTVMAASTGALQDISMIYIDNGCPIRRCVAAFTGVT